MAVDEKKCEKGLGLVRGMKVLYIAKRGPNNIAAKTYYTFFTGEFSVYQQ